MERRIAIWRIVWSIIAVGLIVVTVFSWLEFRRLDLELKNVIEARPLAAAVDLSRQGQFTAQLRQRYSGACREVLYLDLAQADVVGRSPAELLEDLEGSVSVSDSEGNIIISEEITKEWDSQASDEEAIALVYFSLPEKGDYTLTLYIAHGADALKGIEQNVFVKHLFCGLESMAVGIIKLLTWGLAIPALIISLLVARGFWKYGVWRHTGKSKG